MSHNIERKSEKAVEASMFNLGYTPWHGLGKVVEEAQTAEQVIKLANLDYTVAKARNQVVLADKTIVHDNSFTVYRTDTNDILSTRVGASWTPLQNVDAFNFFDQIVDRDEAIYHSAGVLGIGEKTWILAKLPEYVRVGNDDIIEEYVVIMNGFDGMTAIKMFTTQIRVVCNNTLNAAIAGAKKVVSISHTPDVEKKVGEAVEAFGFFNQFHKDMEDVYNHLANKQMSDKQLQNFLATIFPINDDVPFTTNVDKAREASLQFYHEGVGQDVTTARGTAFGAYQAITGYTSHLREYKNGADQKFKNLLLGGKADKINQQAFDLLGEFANDKVDFEKALVLS